MIILWADVQQVTNKQNLLRNFNFSWVHVIHILILKQLFVKYCLGNVKLWSKSQLNWKDSTGMTVFAVYIIFSVDTICNFEL